MERFKDAFENLRAALHWAPDSVVALVMLALAALVALAFHRIIVATLRRLLRERHPYVRSFLAQTKGVTRAALVVLALASVLPVTPLSDHASSVIAKLLLLATIALIGWAAITALHLASDLYLMRFRLDVSDNMLARKHITQVRILGRAVDTLIIIVTVAAALMTFDAVRHYGVTLFASAGVAGLVVGFAARPVLSNLIAGVQLAVTQPIRIDDSVVIENESGTIEEITATYVVVRLWDWRRLVVPLTHFIDEPFQNLTRDGSALIGTVMLYLDYTAPIARIREKATEIVNQSKLWDQRVFNVQVSDAKEATIEVRILVSSLSGSTLWDLRCELREKLIDFLQRECPTALPRRRQQMIAAASPAPDRAPNDEPPGKAAQ